MEAETHLRRSTELDPTYALAWGNLGVLLTQTEALRQAVPRGLQRRLVPDRDAHRGDRVDY